MPRDSMVRLKAFQVNEKARLRDLLVSNIEDLTRMADDLGAQIAAEEARSGITDPQHFAYPMTAKAARTRQANLLGSVKELKVQVDAAAIALEEAEAELAKAEALDRRDGRVPAAQVPVDNRSGMIG